MSFTTKVKYEAKPEIASPEFPGLFMVRTDVDLPEELTFIKGCVALLSDHETGIVLANASADDKRPETWWEEATLYNSGLFFPGRALVPSKRGKTKAELDRQFWKYWSRFEGRIDLENSNEKPKRKPCPPLEKIDVGNITFPELQLFGGEPMPQPGGSVGYTYTFVNGEELFVAYTWEEIKEIAGLYVVSDRLQSGETTAASKTVKPLLANSIVLVQYSKIAKGLAAYLIRPGSESVKSGLGRALSGAELSRHVLIRLEEEVVTLSGKSA